MNETIGLSRLLKSSAAGIITEFYASTSLMSKEKKTSNQNPFGIRVVSKMKLCILIEHFVEGTKGCRL